MSSVELRKRREMLEVVRSACKGGNSQPLVAHIKANDDYKDHMRFVKACHDLLRRREFKIATVAEVQSTVIAELMEDVKEDPSSKD